MVDAVVALVQQVSKRGSSTDLKKKYMTYISIPLHVRPGKEGLAQYGRAVI
jgi:hypothetical protein